VSLGVAFTAAACGLLMTSISGGATQLGVAILAGIALASGVLFPWEPRMFVPPGGGAPAGGVPAGLLGGLRDHRPQVAPGSPQRSAPAYAPTSAPSREVPDWVRWVWRGAMALLIALGPVLIAAAESNDNNFNHTDFVIMRAVGVGIIILGVLCFVQSFRRRINGWWSYLIKPLILYACLQIILISAFLLGMSGPNDGMVPAGIFFIIFPAIMFLTLLFVRTKSPRFVPTPAFVPAGSPPPLPGTSPASRASDLQPMTSPSAAQFSAPSSFAPAASAFSTRRPRPSGEKLRMLANFIGWALHTLTFFIAIAVVINLPSFIDAGLMDQRLADDMRRNLGANWPKVAHLQGYILTYIGAFLATMFLMIGRRSQGIFHMIRPIFAAACFLVAMVMLDHSLSGVWKPIDKSPAAQVSNDQNIPRADVGDRITQYLEAGQAKMSIVSLFLALTGLALLLWPAPQARSDSNFDHQEGVS
ncbi:MAG TPA: hypothetical protein VGP94_00700, partial [Tepidisphaeraceae bacterium]|nr:hypothetical protein [Tepidisphaeraceae bacterium]